MKRNTKKITKSEEEMLPEYDFSGIKGVQGKHYKQFQEGVTVTVTSSRKKQRKRSTRVVLEPDIALKFKNSKQVNNALRSVIAVKGR